MKKIVLTVLAASFCLGLFAQDSKPQIKWYGFIRNYYAYDSRESTAGTGDLYYYFPLDEALIGEDVDSKEISSLRFSALTSRLGLDLVNYEYDGYKMGGKIEADFYSGLTGVTGTAQFRLRQAFITINKGGRSWKLGQAWHPMAADLPDIFSLESGVPFGPFSRTPQVTFEQKICKNLSVTLSAITQMQYISPGPSVTECSKSELEAHPEVKYKYTSANSADYAKYSCIPEFYAALNLKGDKGLLRIGADYTSLKPRNYIYDMTSGKAKAKTNELQHELSFYTYGSLKLGALTIKDKITYARNCSHMNMIGGYGVSGINEDGSWEFTTTSNVSGWMTFQYKAKDSNWVPSLFIGYIRNFGTDAEVLKGEAGELLFFGKNKADAINSMYRIQPEVLYNIGKFQIGLEYMMTAVNYGKADAKMLATEKVHLIRNNRIQIMTKFSF